MTILGIDPGSVHTGYGVIACSGSEAAIRGHGAIHPAGSHLERLKQIYQEVAQVVTQYAPTACAVEMPVYGLNPQAMLKLGRAQAAAMLAALHKGITVAQYSPKEVKLAVTGNGNASKEQVAYMVRSLLGMREETLSLDETDAIAVALCHRNRQAAGGKLQTHTDWAAFVRRNPHRTR